MNRTFPNKRSEALTGAGRSKKLSSKKDCKGPGHDCAPADVLLRGSLQEPRPAAQCDNTAGSRSMLLQLRACRGELRDLPLPGTRLPADAPETDATPARHDPPVRMVPPKWIPQRVLGAAPQRAMQCSTKLLQSRGFSLEKSICKGRTAPTARTLGASRVGTRPPERRTCCRRSFHFIRALYVFLALRYTRDVRVVSKRPAHPRRRGR